MKYMKIGTRILVIFSLVFLGTLHQNCDDVEKYKPPPDSLIDPPNEVPQLLFPPDDTHFIFGQQGHGWDTIWVDFKWTSVTDAQYYDLEISTEPDFPENISSTYRSSATSRTLALPAMGDCFWHVRAGNDYWKWFTGWSDTGHFKLIYPPY